MRQNTIVIHQPDFLPWLGFFHRLLFCDTFIILDDVQFLNRGWHHRDKIKTKNGLQWLTVPIKKKGRYGQSISEVEIDHSDSWRQKHLKTIHHAYSKASFFKEIMPEISEIYNKSHKSLLNLNIEFINLFINYFDVSIKILFSSDFEITKTGTEKLVLLVRKAKGTAYLSGSGAKSYLNEELFIKQDIQLVWQEFKHPQYSQLYGDFIAELSSLDFIMNCGKNLKKYILFK